MASRIHWEADNITGSITNVSVLKTFHIRGTGPWLGFLQYFDDTDRKDATPCFIKMMGLDFDMLLAGGSDTGIPPAELAKTWNAVYMHYLPLLSPIAWRHDNYYCHTCNAGRHVLYEAGGFYAQEHCDI